MGLRYIPGRQKDHSSAVTESYVGMGILGLMNLIKLILKDFNL